MTKLITSIADKKEAIELLEVILQRFLFGALKPEDVQGISAHLNLMRHHPYPMNVVCNFATEPVSQITRVVLSYQFSQPTSEQKQNG